jgi:hypothetical protein
MRTNLVNPETVAVPTIPKGYKGTMADYVLQALLASHGNQALDPRKTAQAIVKEVLHPSADPPLLRMPLGKESLEGMRGRARGLLETAEKFEKVALAADF